MFILRNIDCLRKPILYFVRIFIEIFFFFVIVICSFCIAIVYTKLQYVKRVITIKKNIFYNNKLPTSPPDSPNFE